MHWQTSRIFILQIALSSSTIPCSNCCLKNQEALKITMDILDWCLKKTTMKVIHLCSDLFPMWDSGFCSSAVVDLDHVVQSSQTMRPDRRFVAFLTWSSDAHRGDDLGAFELLKIISQECNESSTRHHHYWRSWSRPAGTASYNSWFKSRSSSHESFLEILKAQWRRRTFPRTDSTQFDS